MIVSGQARGLARKWPRLAPEVTVNLSIVTDVIVALVAVVLILAIAAAWVNGQRARSAKLQSRFGPEYDRTLESTGSRKQAEEELAARQKRVQAFNIRYLTTDERKQFSDRWRAAQAQFVDNPSQAIVTADRLVDEVMRKRGYPVGDFEQNAADLSVDHAEVVSNYRAARALVAKNEQKQASTEDLRQAMVHFRALFDDLLAVPDEVAQKEQNEQNEQKEAV